MSAVQPVIDMNFGGDVRMNDYSNLFKADETFNIAGTLTQTYRMLSYGQASGGTDQIVVPLGYHCVIWGFKIYLQFTAAGAAAFANKYISMNVKMNTPASGVDVTKWGGTALVPGGTCQLFGPGMGMVALNRNDIQVIPLGCSLDVVVWSQDGTNFPVNTNFIYQIVGQCFPAGAPIPAKI